MYKKASRLKLRFESSRGPLTAEMLWDLKITELKTMVKAQAEKLQKLERPGDDLSFLEEIITSNETKEIEIEKLRFDILKDVFITRKDEAKDAAAYVKKKEELSHLREILRDKKEEELKKLSAEELEERIKKLEEGK